MKDVIDINADLGEGTGLDEQIMPLISSCSIACGGHFGTEDTMRETVRLALQHKVKIGAHPSFPDRDNFGRKLLTMTKQELSEAIYFQILQFLAICETENAELHHIKLHGALYNYAAKDAPTADAVVEAITSLGIRPNLYVPHGSVLHRKAENLLPLVFEAFIDRRYGDDGALLPRSETGAVLTSRRAAWEQLSLLVHDALVISNSGKKLSVVSETYCIHSDTPQSVEMLVFIREHLRKEGIEVR